MTELFKEFHNQIAVHLTGRQLQARMCLAALLTGGHVLIEDIPGVGKTMFSLILAKLSGLRLGRIQCTNDMLPSDIIGSTIWHPGREEFSFRAGPLFSQMLLADELNRAPLKTQSALLQAMEEKKVSIDGKDFLLPKPFIVLATQNPTEWLGVNPLPESQIDRFAISMLLPLSAREVERKMIQFSDTQHILNQIPELFNYQNFSHWREELQKVFIHQDLIDYILDILQIGRQHPLRAMDLSTRTGRDLVQLSKALAFIDQEKNVLPEHIKELFSFVAAHRLGGRKGVAYGQKMAAEILAAVRVP